MSPIRQPKVTTLAAATLTHVCLRCCRPLTPARIYSIYSICHATLPPALRPGLLLCEVGPPQLWQQIFYPNRWRVEHFASTKCGQKGFKDHWFFGPSPTLDAPFTRAFSFTFTGKNYVSRHLSISCSHHLSHCHCGILSRSQVEIQDQIWALHFLLCPSSAKMIGGPSHLGWFTHGCTGPFGSRLLQMPHHFFGPHQDRSHAASQTPGLGFVGPFQMQVICIEPIIVQITSHETTNAIRR